MNDWICFLKYDGYIGTHSRSEENLEKSSVLTKHLTKAFGKANQKESTLVYAKHRFGRRSALSFVLSFTAVTSMFSVMFSSALPVLALPPSGFVTDSGANSRVIGLGVVPNMPNGVIRAPRIQGQYKKRVTSSPIYRKSSKLKLSTTKSKTKKISKPVHIARQPQDYIGQLQSRSIGKGVIHRSYRGAMNINVLDIDMVNSPLTVKPVLASDTFNKLLDVRAHARKNEAVAAINANYFKPNGTPLGTVIMDGEWVSGSLYERVALGFTDGGFVRIDRVDLHGDLTSSNSSVGSLWVSNINQPRRTGSRLMVYNRRWGNSISLPFDGNLVAIGTDGKVQAKHNRYLVIPEGGYVLCDLKSSKIAELQIGDSVNIEWKVKPDSWNDITHAVSGGPMLIRNGKIYLDVKDENFRSNWTGSHITARTIAGVTAHNHLILATIEGSHSLWDAAKFLKALGAVEALNLDGGGSTTMVVHGKTVTRNAHDSQRHVVVALALLGEDQQIGTTNYVANKVSGKGVHKMLRSIVSPPEEMDLYQPSTIAAKEDGNFKSMEAACDPKAGVTGIVSGPVDNIPTLIVPIYAQGQENGSSVICENCTGNSYKSGQTSVLSN